ncbi:HAD family hydrolase [Bythopirellula goksoeyrii]|uniref:Beta-phosphoglucomutase n=1 Tax=Bythopirellula goksoeyrii TaxID=1400387 RepID=A0A5B9QJC6_9BACT|nr:HAD family phosphatase [Bythopirellula goksoeyrii]QEG37645.1 Beta-phosphoglucomutase [Bythopirellula goksoeyrii]
MPRSAVIFDVDGVLIDSYQAHYESWLAMFAEQGVSFTEQDFRATFGRTSHDIIAALYGKDLNDAEIREWDNRKEALYRDIIRKSFPAIDGAVELLDSLAADGFRLAVGSSGPPENIALTLDCLGRSELFAAKVTRVDVTRGKPDPQVFQIAAQRLGADPSECVVVEDAPAGIEAANRAEMASVALTGTATREELSHALMVVDSLRELTPTKLRAL